MKLSIDLTPEQFSQIQAVAKECCATPQIAVLRLTLVGCRLFPGMASDVGFELGMDLNVNSEGSVGIDPKLPEEQRDPEEESVEFWHRDTGEAQQRIGG